MSNANDPRLRQDKVERKDRENSNAGMIAGVIIVIIGIIGIYLYYTYEVVPTQTPLASPTTATTPHMGPSPTTTGPTNNNMPAPASTIGQ